MVTVNGAELMREIVATNPEIVSESFEKVTQVMQKQGFGRGWPIFGIVFMPRALERQLIPIWEATVTLRSKVVEAFLKDPSLRPMFGFTAGEEELLLNDPLLKLGEVVNGSVAGLPLILSARPDGFITNSDNLPWVSNEANTGEPGGMDYHDIIGDVLWESDLGRFLRERLTLTKFSLRRNYALCALKVYRKWRKIAGGSSFPRIVVVGEEADRETKLLANAFSPYARNVPAVTVEDTNWKFCNGKLYYCGEEVDLLVRASSADVSVLDSCSGAVTQALKSGAVLAFPNLCGRVGGNKVTDYLLSQNLLDIQATKAEETARKTIANTQLAQNVSVDFAIRERKHLVLKANLGGGGLDCPGGRGIDVTLGSEVDIATWRKLLQLAMQTNTRVYLLQEMLEQTIGKFVSVQENGLGEYDVAWGIDPYIIGGKFSGYASRGGINPRSNAVKLNVGDGTAHSGCVYTVG